MPFLFPLLATRTEEGRWRVGSADSGGLGARGWRRSEGKGRREREDSIPGLTSCGGGAWRPGHGGQRRRVEALAAAALLAEERGLGLAVWLVVVGVVLGGALYSRGRAVGGVEVRSAGERCGRS